MKNNNVNIRYHLIVFLIQPIIGTIIAFLSPKNRVSRIILFLFGLLFGYSLLLSSKSEGLDFYVTTQKFLMYDLSLQDIISQFVDLLTFKAQNEKDIYQNFLIYFVRLFTSNYHFFWALGALVYSFFYGLILLLMFSIPAPYLDIIGLRFWTAAWMSVYATLMILLKSKNKYFLLLLISPFIHIGFWFYLIMLLIYKVSFSNIRIWYILFCLSLPFTILTLNNLDVSLQFLPANMQSFINRYLDKEVFSVYNSAGSGYRWVQTFFDNAIAFFYIICMFLLYKSRHIHKERVGRNLLLLALIITTISNIILPLPYIGIRYRYISWIFISFLWVRYIPSTERFSKFVYIFPFVAFFEFYDLIIKTYRCVDASFFYRDFISLLLLPIIN